jgi:hypothetical protein
MMNVYFLVAYIDPGSGSFLLQLLLGGFAGAWILLKLFGLRLLHFLGIKKKETPATSTEESN